MADTPTQAEVDTLFKNLEDSSRRYNSANFRQDGKALAYFGVAVEKHRAALKEACTAMIERIAELEAMLKRLEWDDKWDEDYCPTCDARRKVGHEDNCELAALLPKEATDE